MIDIHCHILPRVDDGPRSLGESLTMLRKMAYEGITHVVATPHCNEGLLLFRGEINGHVARLNEAIARQGIGVTILPGSEIGLYDIALYRRNYERGLFCHLGDDPAYSLLEFPWQSERVPDGALALVQWLREQGTTPIIAHPERTPFLRENRELLDALVEAGAWLQITVDSLAGTNTPVAQAVAEELIAAHPNIVLASDAHNLDRCSGLAAGYDVVRQRFGPQRADDLKERADSILQYIASSAQGNLR